MADDHAPLLDEFLARHWPAVAARLGERQAAFLKAIEDKTALRRFEAGAPALRFANLCFALGPAFEDKPENEWALAILSNERLAPWVKLHQLVRRSVAELQRRAGDGGAMSRQLLASDTALLDVFEPAPRRGKRAASPVPRVACDLEAVDIRLLDTEWRQDYQRVAGTWQRVASAASVTSVRIAADRPMPEMLSVLTHASGVGPAARLQLRLLTHAVCNQDIHPDVVVNGGPERLHCVGHAARAVSWPVYSPSYDPVSTGLGVALVEETAPDISGIRMLTCGVRDEGVPTGALQVQVWSYPADQWLFALQRQAAPDEAWPQPAAESAAPAAALTRCRIERDGEALDSRRWVQGFDEALPAALRQGLGRLFDAWCKATAQASMRSIGPGLLSGRAALTWGWREGAQGLGGRPLLRAVGEFDLNNTLDLTLEGDIELGATRTRLRLRAAGEAPLRLDVARDQAVPGLLDALLPVAVRWRWPFQLDFDPIATEDAALWSGIGLCTGGVIGEATLRPRLTGGSGWQWYLRLGSEAVSVSVTVHDPVLGQTLRNVELLPAVDLLDWCLG